MLRFFFGCRNFSLDFIEFSVHKNRSCFCRNSTRANTNKIPEKNMCVVPPFLEKWCWCRCLDFYYRRKQTIAHGIQAAFVQMCTQYGSYIHNFTWVSYIFRFHLYTSVIIVVIIIRVLWTISMPTNAFNQRATFTIQIIFLNVFELLFFFFHFAPKTISIGMVDDIMYCSWLVHMTLSSLLLLLLSMSFSSD